jgi:hypothetical protein
MVRRQAVCIYRIKKELDRTGQVILTTKDRNRIDMIAQTLIGFRFLFKCTSQRENPTNKTIG